MRSAFLHRCFMLELGELLEASQRPGGCAVRHRQAHLLVPHEEHLRAIVFILVRREVLTSVIPRISKSSSRCETHILANRKSPEANCRHCAEKSKRRSRGKIQRSRREIYRKRSVSKFISLSPLNHSSTITLLKEKEVQRILFRSALSNINNNAFNTVLSPLLPHTERHFSSDADIPT
eukprot:scaffold2908_cov257-Pinguiococcus_pyrenoidosus.AAC.28